jgi:curli biogenesis system outer membrane secretion channel CsgG
MSATVLASVQAPETPRKKRIAVMDFDYATVHAKSTAIFGQDVDIGKGIADLLVANMVKDGNYSVFERKALDKLLAEQNFSNSDRANPTSAAKIGKLLGVDAIVLGSITQFGNEIDDTTVGGTGGALLLGPYGHRKFKAIVDLTARIVDIDTGEILAAAYSEGESKRKSKLLVVGGRGWRGVSADFGSSDFQYTVIGEAVKAAVDRLASEVIADREKLHARTIVVSGLIASLDGEQIILNVGSKAGIKIGDQLNVERINQEIKDPATGEVIRRLASQLGVLKVMDVDDTSAACGVVSGSGFQIGDTVKMAAP